jgi:hypothetical protein
VTAERFCERVWDHSWKYTPDTEHCMRLWFNGSAGNPNDVVAQDKLDKIIKTHRLGDYKATSSAHVHNLPISLLVLVAALLGFGNSA